MRKPHPQDRPGLRDLARTRGLLFGAAVSTADLDSEAYRAALLRECSLISAEYEMKWDAVERVGYGPADALVGFAGAHGLAVHGHTLWWHESVPPPWSGAPRDRFAAAAFDHLGAAVGRYAGRIASWDVVNEPLDLDHGRSGGLRASPFLDAFGPGYVGAAFRAAAEADARAVLVLNEMGLEYDSPDADAKRRAMLDLLERELAAGTPIHALGMQSHIEAGSQPRDHPALAAFLREVAGLGLSVMITEMDVADWRCPRDRRDAMVADAYRRHIGLVLEACPTLAVTTWGLADARTWLSAFRPREDGAPVRPLPLDRRLRRKPAWHAIAAALAATPPCGTLEPDGVHGTEDPPESG
ncbi:MAG TPA: endo-1,4-beta-xylanase [Microvirga sp.]|jgi:endo-1,4-beta-xylanase|nr:endo-1,4-beta-xylanase [Microvirga sp.]